MAAAFLGLGASACGSSAPAPALEGARAVAAWTCGSRDVLAWVENNANVDARLRSITHTIGGGQDRVRSRVSDTCSFTVDQAFASAAGTVTLTVGDTACDAACSTAQCLPDTAPTPTVTETYAYTLTADHLVWTRTLTQAMLDADDSAAGAGCAVGDLETISLQ